MKKQIEAARTLARAETFGTDAWEAAMAVVRKLCREEMDAAPREEFCSVDSGIHRTRLPNGKIR